MVSNGSGSVGELDVLPDLLTVEEYAAWARRGRNQAYDDVRRGDVPSLRLGKAIRIPKRALLTMIATRSPVVAREPAA